MKKIVIIVKWIFRVLLGLTFLWLILGLVTVYIIIPNNKVETMIQDEINKVINVKNGHSDVSLTFLSTFPNFSLVLNDLYLIDTTCSQADTIFTLDRLQINLNIHALAKKKIAIKKIELLKPYLHIRIDSSGTANLSQVFKLKAKNDTIAELPSISLNDLSVNSLSVKYENYSISKFFRINGVNLGFRGMVNPADTIIDIHYGGISIEKNSFDFNGNITKGETDLKLSYDLNNAQDICKLLYEYTGNEAFDKTQIKGHFNGDFRLKGQINDTSCNSLKISGNTKGEEISIVSQDNNCIVKDGRYDIDLFHDFVHDDSLRININELEITGDDIYLEAKGNIRYYDNDYHINSTINSKGDLTKLTAHTSYLKKGTSIRGQYDIYANLSTSLDSLLHNYSFPKDINNLKSKIKIPNINGEVDVRNFIFKNKKVNISTKHLKTYFDGTKGAIFKINYSDLKLGIKEHYITSQKAEISLNGRSMKSHLDIKQLGYINKKGPDTTIIHSENIKLDISPNGKNIADGSIEELNINKSDNTIFAAKIFFNLLKKNLANKKNIWEAIESRAFIVTFSNKDLSSYGKIIKGKCNYTNKISDISVLCDSIDIKVPNNELIANNISLTGNNNIYHVKSRNVKSKQLDYGIPINISNINADYSDKAFKFSTGTVLFGESKIVVNGDASLKDKKKTKATLNISGEHMNINQIMYAQNVHLLAKGDPNAIPLNEIPKGALPRGIGKEKNDIRVNLNLKLLTISSLTLDNAKGSINIKGREILLDNITSKKDNAVFQFSSLYKYIDPDHSMTTVALEGQKMSMSRLIEIVPEISKLSPMLTALEGTANFKINALIPVHKVIKMDISKTKIAGALQSQRLAIIDNESLARVAKMLMFKNKTKTEIDSLSAAIMVDNGQVEILPFMMKVDRYKVAMAGNSSLATEAIDYHISVLKSPVPFKFGINVTGNNSPYKIKLVKTQYKNLDPSIMPWTDPKFISYRNSLYEPISNFRAKHKL